MIALKDKIKNYILNQISNKVWGLFAEDRNQIASQICSIVKKYYETN